MLLLNDFAVCDSLKCHFNFRKKVLFRKSETISCELELIFYEFSAFFWGGGRAQFKVSCAIPFLNHCFGLK